VNYGLTGEDRYTAYVDIHESSRRNFELRLLLEERSRLSRTASVKFPNRGAIRASVSWKSLLGKEVLMVDVSMQRTWREELKHTWSKVSQTPWNQPNIWLPRLKSLFRYGFCSLGTLLIWRDAKRLSPSQWALFLSLFLMMWATEFTSWVTRVYLPFLASRRDMKARLLPSVVAVAGVLMCVMLMVVAWVA